MSFIFSTLFSCLSLGFALVLLFAIFRYIFKGKYAESFSKMPDATRERLLSTDIVLIKIFSILLWFSPFYLIFFPIVLFAYFKDFALVGTICMVLFFIMLLQEYLFRKWLGNYLKTYFQNKTL